MQKSILQPDQTLPLLKKLPQLRESYFRICELDPENSYKQFINFITLQIIKLKGIPCALEPARIFRVHYQLLSLKIKVLRPQTVQGAAIAEIRTDCGYLRVTQDSFNEITIKGLNSLEIQLSTVMDKQESKYFHIDLLGFLSLLDIYAVSSLQFTYQYSTQQEDIVLLFGLEKNTRMIDRIEAYKSEQSQRKTLEVGVKELEQLLTKLKTLDEEGKVSNVLNSTNTHSKGCLSHYCNIL